MIACKIAHHREYYYWPVSFFVIGVSSFAVVSALKPFAQDLRLLVFTLWLFIVCGFLILCFIYNKRRPGAFLSGVVFFIITGMVYSVFLFSVEDRSMNDIFIRGVEATRWIINLNIISWVIFVFGTLFSSLLGFLSHL